MKKARSQDYIVSFDRNILTIYLLLCAIGLFVMLDISSMQSSLVNFIHHGAFLGVSFLAVIVVLYFFDISKLRVFNTPLLWVVIGLLVLVLLQKSVVKGAVRQIDLGFIHIQPSFMARLALVLFYAGYLAKKEDELRAAGIKEFFRDFLPLLIYPIIVFYLIFVGKHLSTLVIAAGTLMGMLIYAGLKKRLIALAIILALVGGTIVLTYGEGYRKSRIQTYLKYFLLTKNDQIEPSHDEGYQVLESLTALTSGKLFGTGISRGRAKHYYLPEARSDYIYTIIGEEFGFIGAFLVLALHALLFFLSFKLADRQDDPYLKYLCAGLAMNIFLNALVNTGVSMAILPTTGNTLPFVSYGGTALLVDSVSVGIILNVSAKRRKV